MIKLNIVSPFGQLKFERLQQSSILPIVADMKFQLITTVSKSIIFIVEFANKLEYPTTSIP